MWVYLQVWNKYSTIICQERRIIALKNIFYVTPVQEKSLHLLYCCRRHSSTLNPAWPEDSCVSRCILNGFFRVTLVPQRPVSLRWCPLTLHISTELFTVGQLGTSAPCPKCGFQIWTPILHHFSLQNCSNSARERRDVSTSSRLEVWVNH